MRGATSVNTNAPGMAGPSDPADALADANAAAVNRLRAYLSARYPGEVEAAVSKGNFDPAALAIALMDRLPMTPGTRLLPCHVAHCNRPGGHIDDHSP